MKSLKDSRIGWSLCWALAMLIAAFVFKGSDNAEWVKAGLLGMAVSFVVLGARRRGCSGVR